MSRLDAIPLQSEHVVVRHQDDGVLLFQQRRDEMYLAPNAVLRLLSLCDGSRTIAELAGALSAPGDAVRMADILDRLAERELVELW